MKILNDGVKPFGRLEQQVSLGVGDFDCHDDRCWDSTDCTVGKQKECRFKP